MDTFVKVDAKFRDLMVKRKEILIAAMEGRTQSYISEKTGIDLLRLNKWINGIGILEDSELNSLSTFLNITLK